jgi:hypothetical protein
MVPQVVDDKDRHLAPPHPVNCTKDANRQTATQVVENKEETNTWPGSSESLKRLERGLAVTCDTELLHRNVERGRCGHGGGALTENFSFEINRLLFLLCQIEGSSQTVSKM